jgi:hypothetical protein
MAFSLSGDGRVSQVRARVTGLCRVSWVKLG